MDKKFISINQLIEYFKLFAGQHQQINSFYCGDSDDLPTSVIYPMLFVNFRGGRVDDNMITRIIHFYAVDKMTSDRANKNEIYSDMERVLLDLKSYFERAGVYENLFVELQNNIEKVTEEFNTELVYGQEMQLDIKSPYLGDICSIPGIFTGAYPVDYSETITPVYLTCQSLSGCSVIQDINQRIDNLNLSGGSSFDCSQLSGCSIIQELQTDIYNINTFSGNTENFFQDLSDVITEHTTSIWNAQNDIAAISASTSSVSMIGMWGTGNTISQCDYAPTVTLSSTVAANTLYFIPFLCKRSVGMSELKWYFANSGIDWSVALYSSNINSGKPDQKIINSGAIAVGTSNSIKTYTLSTVQNLTMGEWYYYTFHCNSAINLAKATAGHPILNYGSAFNVFVAGYTASHSFASGFPADTSSLTLSELTGSPILIGLTINNIL